MSYQKSKDDLFHSIEILEANIRLFHEGNMSMYRVVAVQLRLLLCDSNPLLPRLFKKPSFHPLFGYISKEEDENFKKLNGFSLKETTILQFPGIMNMDGKGSFLIEKLFDESKPPIVLGEWLDQPLFTNAVTIRKLIRSVADRESAHSDNNYDDTLKFTKSLKIVDEELHIRHIVAIGEYVLYQIKDHLGDMIVPE